MIVSTSMQWEKGMSVVLNQSSECQPNMTFIHNIYHIIGVYDFYAS